MESVHTCCGMTPRLKCPPCYREDAPGRFKHARPRKRDAANTAFVPLLDLYSLISAWSVKNGAKRTGRTSDFKRYPYKIYRDGLYSRCFRFNFSLEFADCNGAITTTLLLPSRNSLNDNDRQLFAFSLMSPSNSSVIAIIMKILRTNDDRS